jgi:hypothetical protein
MTTYADLHPTKPTIKTLNQSEWNALLASIPAMSVESRSKHSTGPVAIADVQDRRTFYVLAGSAGSAKFDPAAPEVGAHFWSLNASQPTPEAAPTKVVKANEPYRIPTPVASSKPVTDTRSSQPVKRPSKLIAGANAAVKAVSNTTAGKGGLLAQAAAAAKKAGGSY